MTLGDLANLALTTLQQPGADFSASGPDWTSVTNAQFSQGLIEFCLNQAYAKAMGDLEDLELTLVTFSITSTATTYKYAIPNSGDAPISHVGRVFYNPAGLPYTWEFRPGSQLISWSEYQQKYTGQGYLTPYSFGTQPMVATIDPLLQNLYFYPGSARAGDTITVEYQPLPFAGASLCPTLVAAGDTPLLPLDTHIAIFYYAMWLLWARAREMSAMELYDRKYLQELAIIRAKYTKKHHGDTMRIEPFGDGLTLNSFSM